MQAEQQFNKRKKEMGVITLPYSMEQDRLNQIKANSVHVDANFTALLNATNNKLEKDGSIIPTADLSMGSHKITNLGAATSDGDAVSQGWVNDKLVLKANLASPEFTGEPKAPTPTAGDDSTKIATTAFVNTAISPVMPTGVILPFGGTIAPTGFFLCDGSEISRTTYADLFGVIGTTYGSGDGTTTFNLPNATVALSIVGSVPVKGNGTTIGLTNGANEFGLGDGLNSSANYLRATTANYGKNVGTTQSGTGTSSSLTLGLTTDGDKSGMIADLSGLVTSTAGAIIKY